MSFSDVNWLAILACVVTGQIFLTIWFVVLFGEPWAKAYGAAGKKQHAAEIPGYTYGIGVACMFLLTLGLAGLQAGMKVETLGAGLTSGAHVALCFCVATALPGYAFLKRWPAFFLAIGSQTVLILLLSAILSLWR